MLVGLRPGGLTRCNGNKEHKNGTFGVAVADGRGDGWEPFLWVTEPLILNNLVVVQRAAHDQGTEESDCESRQRMESEAISSLL